MPYDGASVFRTTNHGEQPVTTTEAIALIDALRAMRAYKETQRRAEEAA